jgi:hypothetical protein
LAFHYNNHGFFPPETKKGQGVFAAVALKKEKPWAVFFDPPMAVLVYITLTSPPQRRADQCKIGIKPVTINIIVCS